MNDKASAGLQHQPPHVTHVDQHQYDSAQVWYVIEGEFTIGGKPIYDGRFNMQQRKSVADERTDR